MCLVARRLSRRIHLHTSVIAELAERGPVQGRQSRRGELQSAPTFFISNRLTRSLHDLESSYDSMHSGSEPGSSDRAQADSITRLSRSCTRSETPPALLDFPFSRHLVTAELVDGSSLVLHVTPLLDTHRWANGRPIVNPAAALVLCFANHSRIESRPTHASCRSPIRGL